MKLATQLLDAGGVQIKAHTTNWCIGLDGEESKCNPGGAPLDSTDMCQPVHCPKARIFPKHRPYWKLIAEQASEDVRGFKNQSILRSAARETLAHAQKVLADLGPENSDEQHVPPSPYNPDSSVAPESIEALRRVHGLKRAITERKILEALERLLNGTTIVLKPGYKLNQEALAKEAGIHANTLRRRTPDGALAYAAVLNKLASHRSSGKRTPQLEKDQLLIAALRKQFGRGVGRSGQGARSDQRS